MARAVTVGSFWSSAVEVLTVNSSPDLTPPEVKTWPLIAEPLPSPAMSSHTTKNRPSVSAATAGVHCESDVLVTTNSPPILVPSAEMIWPRMSSLPSDELTVSVHTTTIFPFVSSARPGPVPALDPILTVPDSVEMST